MKKTLKIGFVLAFLGIITSAVPALATTVTNKFYGVVVASDGYGDVTTNDTYNYFGVGSGSVLGKSFELDFTTNTTSGNNYVTGGTYYNGTDPIKAALIINSKSTGSFGNSGDGYYYGGASEYSLQAFTYNSGYQLQTMGVVADMTINKALSASYSLTTLLPALQLSNNDFTNIYADFYALPNISSPEESIVLEILSVNAQPVTPVPEPGTIALLGAGILGLVVYGKRRSNIKA